MNPVRKYRKKPVVIEAVEWDSSESRYDFLVEWTNGAFGYRGTAPATVATLEGEMSAAVGDYIIKGVAGEFYPCKPDIFHATYEEGCGGALRQLFGESDPGPTVR